MWQINKICDRSIMHHETLEQETSVMENKNKSFKNQAYQTFIMCVCNFEVYLKIFSRVNG